MKSVPSAPITVSLIREQSRPNGSASRVLWSSWSYYHALDRHRPMIAAVPVGRWLRISECLPETVLRRDEWYNDYLLRAGIDDALGVRLFENASHVVLFGVTHGIDQAPFTVTAIAAIQGLLEPLAKLARLH